MLSLRPQIRFFSNKVEWLEELQWKVETLVNISCVYILCIYFQYTLSSDYQHQGAQCTLPKADHLSSLQLSRYIKYSAISPWKASKIVFLREKTNIMIYEINTMNRKRAEKLQDFRFSAVIRRHPLYATPDYIWCPDAGREATFRGPTHCHNAWIMCPFIALG